MFLLLVLSLALGSSLAVSLEKLFQAKISDARCFSQCKRAETAEDQDQCFVICKTLEDHLEEDLCSLTAVCTGGCKVACDAALRKTLTVEPQPQLQEVSLEQCELSWELDVTSQDVVFMVAGRDQGGMWNLVENHLTSQQVLLTPRQAAKFVQVEVFAVSAGQVGAISLDITNNHCYHAVPESREWREDSLSQEETIQDNTSIIATIALTVLAVFAFMIIMGLVVVRWRNSGAARGENCNEDIPELPYAIPGRTVRALETSRDSSSKCDQPFSDYEVVQINCGL